MKMSDEQLRVFLEEYYNKYDNENYIETDPIVVPHSYSEKENIEIAGFIAATLAWGNRKAIIKSAFDWLNRMSSNPIDFVRNASVSQIERLSDFVYRTFNGDDAVGFILSLQNIYNNHGGLENVFMESYKINHSIADSLLYFRNIFFELECPSHMQKHIANVAKNSACKRLNMFLRWMVRVEGSVDFGIWRGISPSDLYMPLDVHSGRNARNLDLLNRNQNDWKSVVELTHNLRRFDAADPVKYDFALFGYGAFAGGEL